MTFCHLIVLILLSVDWLEDPYHGQSNFSCIMASTPCNAHQETKQQEYECVERFAMPVPTCFHPSAWQMPDVVPDEEILIPPACHPSLHILMSLQQ